MSQTEHKVKRVTALVGSARKRHTHHAVEQFLSHLQALGNIEYEIVRLSDYRLETCKGCMLCLNRGEELCPLKDDRDVLIEKMLASDGVILASPNYSYQVSGLMKVFLDRLGFVFHRPCFFGRAFTSIVVQGIYGGGKIVQYFDFIGGGLGFNTVKGSCLTTREPMTAKQQQQNERALAAHSQRFYRKLMQPAYPVPTLFQLMLFRVARTSRKLMLDDTWRDYMYLRDKGWFTSDYYYPVHLGPVKAIAGKLFDALGARMARNG